MFIHKNAKLKLIYYAPYMLRTNFRFIVPHLTLKPNAFYCLILHKFYFDNVTRYKTIVNTKYKLFIRFLFPAIVGGPTSFL